MNKTIRVYGWHPITKESLQGEFYADESPLEDGVYHLPQYTTKKSVPTLKEHECALYDETSDDWLIVPDYRFLSRLCGGEHGGISQPAGAHFLSRLCGGEPGMASD